MASILNFIIILFFACTETKEESTILRWQENQAQTIDWLKSLEPLERQVHIRILLEHDQQLPMKICIDAQTNSQFELCQKYKQRPHLFEQIQQYENNKNSIALLDASTSPLWALSSQDIECEKSNKLDCVLLSITVGTSEEEIASRCNALQKRSKSECYFQSADLHQGRISTIVKQAKLCHAAQPFGDRCLNHMIDQIIEKVIRENAKETILGDTLKQIDLQLQSITASWKLNLRGTFWSYASFRILENAQPECVKRLYAIPKEMHPYVNANVAYFHYDKVKDSAFQELVTQTNDWQEFSCPTNTQRNRKSSPPTILNLWSLKGPYPPFIEESTTKIVYLRKSHRLMSSVTEVENALIWLEAAAQHQDWGMVKQALSSSNTVVRWRAKMIMDGRNQ